MLERKIKGRNENWNPLSTKRNGTVTQRIGARDTKA